VFGLLFDRRSMALGERLAGIVVAIVLVRFDDDDDAMTAVADLVMRRFMLPMDLDGMVCGRDGWEF